MRLGSYPCVLREGTKVREIYGRAEISERHRHRFEVNNAFRVQLEASGLVIAGVSPDEELVEIIELRDHPWFVGVQFHPEFCSTPRNPHPLFMSFIRAALADRRRNRFETDRPATIFFDNRRQDAPIYVIQAEMVNVEQCQRFARDWPCDGSFSAHLRVVTDTS